MHASSVSSLEATRPLVLLFSKEIHEMSGFHHLHIEGFMDTPCSFGSQLDSLAWQLGGDAQSVCFMKAGKRQPFPERPRAFSISPELFQRMPAGETLKSVFFVFTTAWWKVPARNHS